MDGEGADLWELLGVISLERMNREQSDIGY